MASSQVLGAMLTCGMSNAIMLSADILPFLTHFVLIQHVLHQAAMLGIHIL